TADQERQQTEEALGLNLKTSTREENTADATVILPEIDSKTKKQTQRYQLGPAALKGDSVETASAVPLSLEQGSGYSVNIVVKSGATGIDAFNNMASLCVSQSPECPTGRLAVELDGRLLSAHTVQTASFERDKIQVTGSFTKREANDLAIA